MRSSKPDSTLRPIQAEPSIKNFCEGPKQPIHMIP